MSNVSQIRRGSSQAYNPSRYQDLFVLVLESESTQQNSRSIGPLQFKNAKIVQISYPLCTEVRRNMISY